MSPRISFDHRRLVEFCQRWQVAELSLFGSVLRGDFDPLRSDVDVLVEFSPGARIGFLALATMQEELTEIFGRHVDLVPKRGLKPVIRDEVLSSSELLYAAA